MATERMTDEEFKASLDYAANMGWDPHEKAARMLEVAEREALRARRFEQEQAEKMRALEGKLALVMGERDAAETKASLLEQSVAAQKHVIGELRERLRLAQEQASLANDKMAEQVRQARWEVADNAISYSHAERMAYLQDVRDANAPKD